MKRSTTLLYFLLSVLLGFSQLTTSSTLNLRDSTTTTAPILLTIPQGTVLTPLSQNNGWSKVSYQGRTGYVRSQYLVNPSAPQEEIKITAKPTSPIHYYTNVDGQKIQAPTSYDSIPIGATAQCYDGTYSFSTHRKGTCSHHGGVKRWL